MPSRPNTPSSERISGIKKHGIQPIPPIVLGRVRRGNRISRRTSTHAEKKRTEEISEFISQFDKIFYHPKTTAAASVRNENDSQEQLVGLATSPSQRLTPESLAEIPSDRNFAENCIKNKNRDLEPNVVYRSMMEVEGEATMAGKEGQGWAGEGQGRARN